MSEAQYNSLSGSSGYTTGNVHACSNSAFPLPIHNKAGILYIMHGITISYYILGESVLTYSHKSLYTGWVMVPISP